MSRKTAIARINGAQALDTRHVLKHEMKLVQYDTVHVDYCIVLYNTMKGRVFLSYGHSACRSSIVQYCSCTICTYCTVVLYT